VFGWNQTLKLFHGFGAVLFAGEHPRSFGRNLCGDAVHRSLKKRSVAAKTEKLFRTDLATSRPESRSTSTCHDHRMQHKLDSLLVNVSAWVR
jgi:hypothetical protein